LILTPLIIGGSGASAGRDAGLSQAVLPAPLQSIGIKILAFLHLHLLRLSFHVSVLGSAIPKLDLMASNG